MNTLRKLLTLAENGRCCNYRLHCTNCFIQKHFKFQPTRQACQTYAISQGFTSKGYLNDKFLAKLMLKEKKQK